MGVTGHVGLAFDPADEALAIAAVNGEDEGEDSDWLKYQTEFGLIRENYGQLHRVLQALAQADPSLAPLATAIIGSEVVGEGPTHAMCLYRADEVQLMADAFGRLSDAALDAAIGSMRQELPEDVYGAFPEDLPQALAQVRAEITEVAANGWSLIAFMF